MSGGVIVVAGVVVAFALCETVLPWTFAGLRKWRRRAKAKVAEKDENSSADTVETPRLQENAKGTPPPADEQPPADVQPPTIVQPPTDAQSPTDAQPPADGQTATRLWEEARGMAHNFTPDWVLDKDYLTKIYGAAKLGHLEAMAKLGEYALRRGAVVEAYYWTALAKLYGASGLSKTLLLIGSIWMSKGCPAEHRNVYSEFTEMQGSFARALLRIRCAVDAPHARARMRELAEQGCVEAQLFMRGSEAKRKERGGKR